VKSAKYVTRVLRGLYATAIGHDAALLQEALELARIMATAYRTAKRNDGRT
jgi:hypothetical protein